MNRIRYAILYAFAAAASHLESWYWQTVYGVFERPPRERNGTERRRNPRACVLCDGPMRPDPRPMEVMAWFKCGRCHQSQAGIGR